MAQWQQLQRLDPASLTRVNQVYEERQFPREIRHYLCVLLEGQDWDAAAVDVNKASACLHVLLVYLEEEWSRSVQANILDGPNFQLMKDYLLKHFKDEPLNLAVTLSECLKEEKKILTSASESQSSNGSQMEGLDLEVKIEMKLLELQKTIDAIKKNWQSQEEHNGLAQSCPFMDGACLRRTNFITKTKVMLQQIVNILNPAQQMVATLTEVELPEWKCRQRMACVGSPVDTSLDHLQKWFTTVAHVLLRVREQLQELQDQNQKYNSTDTSSLSGTIAEIERSTLLSLTKLLAHALVVEKQPVMSSLPHRPQVLKMGVRFTVAVRFLANLPEFKCLLKVKPVFDKDVEEAKTVKGFRHFVFNEDYCRVLDVDESSGGLVAEFGQMSLNQRLKAKRSHESLNQKQKAKGSSESPLTVTEELHIIKFVTEFQHAGMKFDIEASSLPLVVISSTNQVVSAWASVMWCNMVSIGEPGNLSLFADPPPLTWQQLSHVLSWQFLRAGQRELDQNQLSYLRDKLVDGPDDLVPWSKFSKNENAWIWIDGILDLIEKHLADLWRDGLIMGFVSRKKSEDLLQEKASGTFLLRFSESNKEGAITFSWVEHSNGDIHVHAVAPYIKKELVNTSLPDIINTYSLRAEGNRYWNPLIYLYPDISKDVFGHYNNTLKKSTPEKDGYIPKRRMDVSLSPTPPPSPPTDMDVYLNTPLEDFQLYQEVIRDLLNSPEDIWTSSGHQEMMQTQNDFRLC
ncbi:signal transducer and activator of transcription 1-alpha/beta isoform X2 [Etheostoma spectabile]|uniref:signal transducer and activator of transcription 1-alpha/beta isoform X2 n=1 Tax=Etheostoma spectabile TaxID=54343 RepID=UPI0013AE8B34|nr:signal transducer and activator of transcription 1-alpha/beta-like isoform X2 [Etheostoma spectabile]